MPATSRRELLQLAAISAVCGCARSAPASRSIPLAATELPMRTRPLISLRLSTAPTEVLGPGPLGLRVVYPIRGGTFEGERLRGTVLPGGNDWTVQRPDGVLELDLRATLETDDQALIYLTFAGLRDDQAPGGPYFRTTPRFETAAPRYLFLNRLLAVGTARLERDGPVHVIEEVL